VFLLMFKNRKFFPMHQIFPNTIIFRIQSWDHVFTTLPLSPTYTKIYLWIGKSKSFSPKHTPLKTTRKEIGKRDRGSSLLFSRPPCLINFSQTWIYFGLSLETHANLHRSIHPDGAYSYLGGNKHFFRHLFFVQNLMV
jgi:hypothetical protein